MEIISGAVIKYFLNGVTFIHGQWVKQRLRISHVGANHVILDHCPETLPYEEEVREVRFGFRVSNRGRRVARGVRAYLTKVEGHSREDTEYRELISHSYALPWAAVESRSLEPHDILPGATLNVLLAEWRDDHNFVAPVLRGPSGHYELESYYEDACIDGIRYRFCVAAVDERGHSASTTLHIEKPIASRPAWMSRPEDAAL